MNSLQDLLNFLLQRHPQMFQSQPLHQILQLPPLPYQLQNRNLYNDLGQRYMPGFWQGDWADRTGQAVEDQGNLIMGQRSPLMIPNNFQGPQMIFNPNNFDLGRIYGT